MRRRAFLFSLPASSAFFLTTSCSRQPATAGEFATVGSIVRLDPAFDQLAPANANIEKVAGGFTFIDLRKLLAVSC